MQIKWRVDLTTEEREHLLGLISEPWKSRFADLTVSAYLGRGEVLKIAGNIRAATSDFHRADSIRNSRLTSNS